MLPVEDTIVPGKHQNTQLSRYFQAVFLQLEVPIDEVVLLQPSQALADLPGAYRSDAVDGLEIAMTGPDDRVETAKITYDMADDALGKPW